MDKNLIAEASKHLRLGAITLYEGNLKRFDVLPETGELGQQTKLSVKSDQIDLTDHDAPLLILRVWVDLGVRVVNLSASVESETAPIFQIEATFQLDYAITGQIDSAALNEFARFYAVHNVWPFWRQYVFSMANQAGLPTPEIPLNTSFLSTDE